MANCGSANQAYARELTMIEICGSIYQSISQSINQLIKLMQNSSFCNLRGNCSWQNRQEYSTTTRANIEQLRSEPMIYCGRQSLKSQKQIP